MPDGSSQITIIDKADALRSRAGFFATQRRKDIELYQVLADCLALCEECARTGGGEQLCAAVVNRPDGRRYFEADPDIYLIVGRYVFETEKNRAATWRYTATLREAAKHQIASADFAEWLRTNGGINALFRSRAVEARTARTKTLHLNSPVEVPKAGRFTLTLERDHRGFFNVIA